MTTDQGTDKPVATNKPCVHDSTRRDGLLDSCCLRCGTDGYWHYGHRHDRGHPSGKILIILECPDSNEQSDTVQPERTS